MFICAFLYALQHTPLADIAVIYLQRYCSAPKSNLAMPNLK